MDQGKKIVLSKRMTAVADMVSKQNTVADIGCDHGFVSIYLIQHGICKKVLAMDVNDGPLERAKEHISMRGLSDYIEVRKSDGMEKIGMDEKPEADAAIIAGMGGRLTVRILSDGLKKARLMQEIILQPQSEIFLVRRFLMENGFFIAEENMVLDEGKYYQILKAVPDRKSNESKQETLSAVQEQFGPILLQQRNPVLQEYLERELDKFDHICRQIEGNDTGTIAQISQKQKIIREALTYFH